MITAPETNYSPDAIQHMFLLVESADAVCMINLAGHPLRIREVIFMMIENGCRIMQTNAYAYNVFIYDKEEVEIYDYLSTIIKVRFVKPS